MNTSSTASSSRVAATVDCGAERVVFACHWHEPSLRWVGNKPSNESEIQVVLRTPAGDRISADASWVNRREGEGYVIFTIEDPPPGRWYVEVETARRAHTRYTVGGWVTSEVGLAWTLPSSPEGGLREASFGLVGDSRLISRYSATLTAPRYSVPDLLKKFCKPLARIQPDARLLRSGVDPDLARLLAFDSDRVRAGEPSLLQSTTRRLSIRSLGSRGQLGFPAHFGRGPRLFVRSPSIFAPVDRFPKPGKLTHGLKIPTPLPGSYTLRLRAKAIDPKTGCRFERVAAQSFVVERDG